MLFAWASFVKLFSSLSVVRMARWKKILICAFSLLAAVVLVAACVVYFRFKRGRETFSPPANLASYG